MVSKISRSNSGGKAGVESELMVARRDGSSASRRSICHVDQFDPIGLKSGECFSRRRPFPLRARHTGSFLGFVDPETFDLTILACPLPIWCHWLIKPLFLYGREASCPTSAAGSDGCTNTGYAGQHGVSLSHFCSSARKFLCFSNIDIREISFKYFFPSWKCLSTCLGLSRRG
jgi:hypothetical protein